MWSWAATLPTMMVNTQNTWAIPNNTIWKYTYILSYLLKVPWFGTKVGSYGWVLRLGPNVGSHSLVPWLGIKEEFWGWVWSFISKVGSQRWVPIVNLMLCPFGFQDWSQPMGKGWITRSGLKVLPQGLGSRLGSQIESQNCVPLLVITILC